MRLVAIIALTISTSGCAILVTEQRAVQPVNMEFLSTRRATFDCSAALKNEAPSAAEKPLFKKQIKEAWGQPDEIDIVGTTERWFYRKDRLWSGVWGVLVVIPIPFVFPTGREQMQIDFANDQVKSVNVQYQHGIGRGCSLIPRPMGDGVFFGCQSTDASIAAELRDFCGHGSRFGE